ncbi:MAG TPA: hypothetical protein VNM66_01165 [Thermodesulfobacteriota bacterium]|nr:hypothetical protein [Thermodesulfobacteriota bacterium]
MPGRPRAAPATRRAAPLLVSLTVGLAALLAAARPAAATFNRFLTAQALPVGRWEAGLAGGAGDFEPDYVAGHLEARYGLYLNLEVGARAGALHLDRPDRPALAPLVGLDAKVQVLRESIDIPFDVGVDLAWTAAFPEGGTYSDLAFAALFSGGLPVESRVARWLVPYAGIELVFLSGSARPLADDSALFGLVGGALRAGPRLTVIPELKIGRDPVYGLALRYRF